MSNMTTLPYLALLHQVSYTSVCKELGVTPQQFTDWVKRRRPVPQERLEQAAHYFGVPIELLVDERLYLLELNDLIKLRLKIAYLTEQLKSNQDEEVQNMHRETLEKLQEDVKIQELQERFNVVIQSKDPKTIKLSTHFLDLIEQCNDRQLDQLLSLGNN